jgi:hypothetical protein
MKFKEKVMGILDSFKSKPSLEELQRRNEYTEVELSLAKKKALIKELEAKSYQGKWKEMSDDGTKKGISFQKVITWLKQH